jgi:hypothetical protein
MTLMGMEQDIIQHGYEFVKTIRRLFYAEWQIRNMIAHIITGLDPQGSTALCTMCHKECL